MSIANADQAEAWNSGEDLAHWLNNQARYERMGEPFAALILQAAAFRPGGHVLDLGCGCGRTSRSPRSTGRYWWAAAGASTTSWRSCAPGRWAG